MTPKPNQEMLDEIRDNFDYFDRDNNGQIDVNEFTKLLQLSTRMPPNSKPKTDLNSLILTIMGISI